MTSAPALSLNDMIALARDRAPSARERLLIGIAGLCETKPSTHEAAKALEDILLTLAGQAERDIRRALSARLAASPWAPKALVNVLALDEIEIAGPLLASSPVLSDTDLVRVLVQATLEHQIAIAQRPGLPRLVADAVIAHGEPEAMTVLASNLTADIGEEGLTRLIEISRHHVSLQAPLIRHPQLTQRLAEKLYSWVGAALREAIVTRFGVDETALTAALDDALNDRLAPLTEPAAPEASPEQDDMAQRLVIKLQAAGQLRSSFLIRAAREGRLAIFIHGLSALSGHQADAIRQALAAQTPEPLFYVCASVGIDRAVFPGLLRDIRMLNAGAPGDHGDGAWLTEGLTPEAAALAFSQALAA